MLIACSATIVAATVIAPGNDAAGSGVPRQHRLDDQPHDDVDEERAEERDARSTDAERVADAGLNERHEPDRITNPASPPAILMLAFRPTGCRHVSCSRPTAPRRGAPGGHHAPQPEGERSHRVFPGWLKAARICLATPPESPPASVTSLPLKKFDARLATPTMNKRNGTKNKKSRNAIPLRDQRPL